MIPASLFPLLLLLLSHRAAPTFTDTDPTTGETVVCDRCQPGTYLRKSCTATQKSECAPCPSGSFTEVLNYIEKCLRCSVCGYNQVVKKACAADRDVQCECKQGYYKEKKSDMCIRHSECPSGHKVLTKGTADNDTVCISSPKSANSDISSAQHNCTLHKSCDAPGQQLVLSGAAWHDRVCTSCQELRSRDGGDYLKEILPAFFVRRKMGTNDLRRIVRGLQSENCKKGINRSDLLELIKAWVASATANQIRQLPNILIEARLVNAGKKLQKKLQRIDSNLNKLCALRNDEVDVIVMSD